MTDEQPFASREVRWFFDGSLGQNDNLLQWFRSTEPFRKRSDVGLPTLQQRRGDEPDTYLLLPGRADMGIKWREGLLQVKGRVASEGSRMFCGRHEGVVEWWLKWTYADMPPTYRDLFGPQHGLMTIGVRKMRAWRLIDLQMGVADAEEVSIDTILDCGIAAEVADLEVRGKRYCTLGFEAFPDPAITLDIFSDAVAAFLDGLGEPQLDLSQSQSYPAWLQTLL